MPLPILALAAAALANQAQQPPQIASPPPVTQLPDRTQDPLVINRGSDPILGMARASVAEAEFLALVQQAVTRNPRVDEAQARIAEAEAAEDEAVAGRYPSADLTVQGTRAITRNFENEDPEDIVERARARGRSDALLSVEQTLFDFGATEHRVAAAAARLRSSAAQAESAAGQVALNAIAAWYDVFTYRALVAIAEAFGESQDELRSAIQTRIRAGVSAAGDLPRAESYIASAQAGLARYRRQLANAEARFEEMFGAPAPANLGRAPVIAVPAMSKEAAQALAAASPDVQSAEAEARAVRREARAQRASTLPSVSAGVDAGKYGLLDEDYDVRGRVTLRYRVSGATFARADQAEARANAADARASRVRNEAEREAAIAWADTRSLEQQLTALEASYFASRQSRDVLAERFRVARGTLFDVLESESGYFGVATSYIQAITELDAARYVLLSRTGQLLPTLKIDPPRMEGQ